MSCGTTGCPPKPCSKKPGWTRTCRFRIISAGFERAVSRAASEVVEHLQKGLAVALRTDSIYVAAQSGDRQRARLLAFLALVTPDGRSPQDLVR